MELEHLPAHPSSSSYWREISSAVVTGLIIGAVVLIMTISYGALIFSGPLEAFRAQGISLAIISTVVSGIIFVLYSGARRVLPLPDDDTLPITALTLSLIAGSMAVPHGSSSVFLTAIAAIVITTATCGIFLLALGIFKLGGVIQYLPYSVVGGYFAGAGWLLIVGALKVLLGIELDSLENVSAMFDAANIKKIGLGLTVALSITMIGIRFPKGIAIPLAMVICTILFFAGTLLWGVSPANLLGANWLIGPFSSDEGGISPTLVIEAFSDAHWRAVFTHTGSMLTIVVLSAVSVLLTVNGIDLLEEKELDINHELKVAGAANVLNSGFGGLISFHSFSIATLFDQLNAPASKVVNITAISLCLLGFAYGLSIIQYFPRPVIGGLLFYMGFAFIKEWLVDAWDKFPRYEYLVIPLIFVSIIAFGLIEGVAVGLIASIVIFVFKYSAVEIARYSCSGKQFSSNVERGPAEESVLQEYGDSIYIVRLQGYLFFGTASRLYSDLVERTGDTNEHLAIQFAVYDFAHVTGVDSSAALSFLKMAKLASSRSFFFILAGLEDEYKQRLTKAGFSEDENQNVLFFSSMDHAIEWCENKTLAAHLDDSSSDINADHTTIVAQLAEIFPDENLNDFLGYFTSREIESGYVLCQQGGESDEVYFIDSGEVSVFIETDAGERHRIRRTTVGAVFGELGFYLGTPRTATVVADTDSRILIMNAVSLKKMEQERPDLASIFHQWMVRVVTRRLLNTTRTLSAVVQ